MRFIRTTLALLARCRRAALVSRMRGPAPSRSRSSSRRATATPAATRSSRAATRTRWRAISKDSASAISTAGQVLKIDVLDLDLAGTVRPARRGAGDIRIVRGGADAPHIRVRYALTAGGPKSSRAPRKRSPT